MVHIHIAFEVSAIENAGSMRMTIPKPVSRALDLKKGDKILVFEDDSRICLEKKVAANGHASK